MRKRKTSWYPKRHVTIFCFCFFCFLFLVVVVKVVVVSILLLLFLRLRLLQPGQPLVHLKWQHLNKILKFFEKEIVFFFFSILQPVILVRIKYYMHIGPDIFWHLKRFCRKKNSIRIWDPRPYLSGTNPRIRISTTTFRNTHYNIISPYWCSFVFALYHHI